MISKKTNNEIAENVTICYFCILLRWDIFVYLIYSFIYLFFWGGGAGGIQILCIARTMTKNQCSDFCNVLVGHIFIEQVYNTFASPTKWWIFECVTAMPILMKTRNRSGPITDRAFSLGDSIIHWTGRTFELFLITLKNWVWFIK